MVSKLKTLFIVPVVAAALISLVGCSGAVCPTVAVPLYNITVYDKVAGVTLCELDLYREGSYYTNRLELKCKATYTPSENQSAGSMGDITIELDGYVTTTLEDVKNNESAYACYDQPSYATAIDFYLEPNG